MTDFVNGLKSLSGYRVLTPDQSDFLHDAADEIERLRKALEQIAIVCTDNMGRDCDHRMALDFARQIANDTLDAVGGSRMGLLEAKDLVRRLRFRPEYEAGYRGYYSKRENPFDRNDFYRWMQWQSGWDDACEKEHPFAEDWDDCTVSPSNCEGE